jgi:hypothetical protein
MTIRGVIALVGLAALVTACRSEDEAHVARARAAT